MDKYGFIAVRGGYKGGMIMEIAQFTVKVRITIKGGDGGDGGRGGDVYFVGDKNMTDLFSLRFTSKFSAGNGEMGGSN